MTAPCEGAIFLSTVLHVPAEVVQAALNIGGYLVVPSAEEPEYRNVGTHDFGPGGRSGRCAFCLVVTSRNPCPRLRERRWVTPWEPVPEDAT